MSKENKGWIQSIIEWGRVYINKANDYVHISFNNQTITHNDVHQPTGNNTNYGAINSHSSVNNNTYEDHTWHGWPGYLCIAGMVISVGLMIGGTMWAINYSLTNDDINVNHGFLDQSNDIGNM